MIRRRKKGSSSSGTAIHAYKSSPGYTQTKHNETIIYLKKMINDI